MMAAEAYQPKILLAADINFQKKTWETVENYRLVSPNDC